MNHRQQFSAETERRRREWNVVDLALYRQRREWNEWITSQPIKPRDNGGDDDQAA